MGEPMKTVSLKIPAELDQALTDLAKRQHSSRSALLRKAVEQLTSRDGRTVGELSADLAGAVDGTKDLATSPKHMVGYGE